MNRLGGMMRRFALGPQLSDQGFAVPLQPVVDGRLDAGRLRRLRHQGVQLALRTQAERDRILGDDVGDVPVRPVAQRGDRGAGGADQLGDLAIGYFGVIAQDPRDAIRLVLPLGNRRVARPLRART